MLESSSSKFQIIDTRGLEVEIDTIQPEDLAVYRREFRRHLADITSVPDDMHRALLLNANRFFEKYMEAFAKPTEANLYQLIHTGVFLAKFHVHSIRDSDKKGKPVEIQDIGAVIEDARCLRLEKFGKKKNVANDIGSWVKGSGYETHRTTLRDRDGNFPTKFEYGGEYTFAVDLAKTIFAARKSQPDYQSYPARQVLKQFGVTSIELRGQDGAVEHIDAEELEELASHVRFYGEKDDKEGGFENAEAKRVKLPSREDILKLLSNVDAHEHIQTEFFPLIADQLKGKTLIAHGIANCLVIALSEYLKKKFPQVEAGEGEAIKVEATKLLRRIVPAVITDDVVREEVLTIVMGAGL